MPATTILSVTTVLMAVFGVVAGYAEGPPIDIFPEVCVSMHPTGHNATAQTSTAPFVVSTTCHCYIPGENIYVDFRVHDGRDPLEGIFIQARRTSGDIDKAVGTFSVDPKKKLKTLPCNGDKASAVSHSAEVKERNKGSYWKAPSDLGGANVKFVATALLHTAEFWEFVSSAELGPCPGDTLPYTCKVADVDGAKCSAGSMQPVVLVTVISLTMALITQLFRF